MEHQKELLVDVENIENQMYISGLIFQTLPTYENITNGTADLSPFFQLKQYEHLEKYDLVQRIGVEPTLNGFTDRCLTVRLPLV